MKMYSYKDLTDAPSIKDADKRKGIITGYFAAFGNKDSDGDIITKGAFTKTISENGPLSSKPRIKHLLNHDVTKPLGKIMTLQEDSKGLYYESQVGTHSLGQDFIKMVDSGLISEHSIGYKTMVDDERADARYLSELKLYEGSSLTAWGANEMTPVTGMKGMDKTQLLEQLTKRSEALDSFCRNSTATDETIEMLLSYKDQLLDIIADNQTTEPKPETTPEKEPELKQVTLPDVVSCPACHRITKNTQSEKGYIKCHRCENVFVYGSSLFIKI